MMSQVVAARVAPAAVLSVREAPASHRKDELFTALFERMQASRRKGLASAGADRVDRAAPTSRFDRAGAARSDKGSGRPGMADPACRSRNLRAAESTEGEEGPGRSELRESQRSESEDRAPADATSPPASPDQPAGQDVAQTGRDAREASLHEQEPHCNGREPAGEAAQAGSGGGGPASESDPTGGAGASGQGIAGGVYAVPVGAPHGLPGGSVSMSAPPPGSPNPAGLTGPQATGFPAVPPAALPFADTGSQDESAGLSGEASGGESKSTAGAQAPGKAFAAGGDFGAMLAQVNRGRGVGQAQQIGMGPAGGAMDPVETPIEINGPEGAQDLARVVRAKVGARHSAMMIRFDPPELGQVRVEVKMHQDVLTLRFQAETEAGHDALAGRIHELTGALEEQGIRLNRVEVEYRPASDNQRDGPAPQQQQGGREWQESRRYAGEKDPSGGHREAALGQPSETGGLMPAGGLQGRPEGSGTSGLDVVV